MHILISSLGQNSYIYIWFYFDMFLFFSGDQPLFLFSVTAGCKLPMNCNSNALEILWSCTEPSIFSMRQLCLHDYLCNMHHTTEDYRSAYPCPSEAHLCWYPTLLLGWYIPPQCLLPGTLVEAFIAGQTARRDREMVSIGRSNGNGWGV